MELEERIKGQGKRLKKELAETILQMEEYNKKVPSLGDLLAACEVRLTGKNHRFFDRFSEQDCKVIKYMLNEQLSDIKAKEAQVLNKSVNAGDFSDSDGDGVDDDFDDRQDARLVRKEGMDEPNNANKGLGDRDGGDGGVGGEFKPTVPSPHNAVEATPLSPSASRLGGQTTAHGSVSNPKKS